jgi:hypothetical protein
MVHASGLDAALVGFDDFAQVFSVSADSCFWLLFIFSPLIWLIKLVPEKSNHRPD